MFAWKQTEDHPVIDTLISDLLVHLNENPRHSDEYAKILDQIVKLRTLENQPDSRRVSPDVKATIIANLIGILVIVKHEQFGVVTSKALSFVTKLR